MILSFVKRGKVHRVYILLCSMHKAHHDHTCDVFISTPYLTCSFHTNDTGLHGCYSHISTTQITFTSIDMHKQGRDDISSQYEDIIDLRGHWV